MFLSLFFLSLLIYVSPFLWKPTTFFANSHLWLVAVGHHHRKKRKKKNQPPMPPQLQQLPLSPPPTTMTTNHQNHNQITNPNPQPNYHSPPTTRKRKRKTTLQNHNQITNPQPHYHQQSKKEKEKQSTKIANPNPQPHHHQQLEKEKEKQPPRESKSTSMPSLMAWSILASEAASESAWLESSEVASHWPPQFQWPPRRSKTHVELLADDPFDLPSTLMPTPVRDPQT